MRTNWRQKIYHLVLWLVSIFFPAGGLDYHGRLQNQRRPAGHTTENHIFTHLGQFYRFVLTT